MEKLEALIQERFNQMDEIAERTGFDACRLVESCRDYSAEQLFILKEGLRVLNNPNDARYDAFVDALRVLGKEAA